MSTCTALRGLIVCGPCGKRTQGHMVRRKSAARRVGYQCVYRTEYPGDDTHPRSLFLAEDRILPAVDAWLADLTSPDRLESTVTAILAAGNHESSDPPELRRARHQTNGARKKLRQYLDALEAGMDPALIAERTRLAQGELASAAAAVDAFRSSDSGELSAHWRTSCSKASADLPLSWPCRTPQNASSCTAPRASIFAITAVRKGSGSRQLCAWGCLVSEDRPAQDPTGN